jgi:hypothetical protein
MAQVISPMEIKDVALRTMQQQHLHDLQAIATELSQHKFPYPFYFSRKLDIEEALQKQTEQRSIRFEMYDNKKALVITGNYYASYADELVDADHRLRRTYTDVMLPILQAAVPRLRSVPGLEIFAIEVSHHVRRKVMGLNGEYAENVVIAVPRELAERVVEARDPQEQQTLMIDAEVYHSGEPTVLWLVGERPALADRVAPEAAAPLVASVHPTVANETGARSGMPSLPTLARATVPPELRAAPVHDLPAAAARDLSAAGLKALQEKFQPAIETMVQEHGADAHFVSYAPPAFIAFKQSTYLQLSMTTQLDAGIADSQYKLAALAFDRHIAHLVRPLVGYFKDGADFDGIDFSTTVKFAGDAENTHALAVEFILPLSALNCFRDYDCTGQQLLNAGIILINGERSGLELQAAEAK